MAKFLEHLDHHTKDLFQSTKEVLDENLPIIYNSLATVKFFISLLGKIIKKIPHEIDPIFGEITLKCKGCLLHCPQNWSLTSHHIISFYYVYTKEKCVQKFIVYTQCSRKFVQK